MNNKESIEELKPFKTIENKPTGKMSNKDWIDFLSEQFNVSRTSAKDMLHIMMSVKKEDNFKKMFNPRPQADKEAENE